MEGEIKDKEKKVEILMGQLILIVIVGLLIAVYAGFQMGKEVGMANGISSVEVQKPEYCTLDRTEDKITIQCNELKNVTLDQLCKWVSPELKEKVKIMIIP